MKLAFAVILLLALAFFANADDTIKPLKPSKFCKQSRLTPNNGTQIQTANCVSLEIGQIPSVNNMVSALIISPNNGQTIKAKQQFNVTMKVQNIVTGFFSDPAVDYYQIAQTLQGGKIQGHSHITIQKLDGNNIPDPRIFAFFKGLNDKDIKGVLTVSVDNGLPTPGTYRICTMNSSNSHQPVVMPVAQRGAQDDCIRVTVN